ncbi:MAG: glycosyltransferase family 2 protein [Bacteroidetes bacterium]|nr:glycosyltransferase family 2 protein [Bacteroidota bacterium]
MENILLSVVIPAYNEERTIADVIGRVYKSLESNNIAGEIIVVDDASKDGTIRKVEEYMANHPAQPVRLISSKPNRGKGFAIRQGIQDAKGDYLLVQDADYEYDPRDYPKLLGPVRDGMADVVYGSRFMGGDPHRILFFWHSIGNKFLTFVSNMFTNLNLTDMESGYKLFRREIIQSIRLKENRFGFEPEVTAKIARIPGIRIYEVGISYYGRTYAEGKKINWKDGVRAIICVLKYNLFDRNHFTRPIRL